MQGQLGLPRPDEPHSMRPLHPRETSATNSTSKIYVSTSTTVTANATPPSASDVTSTTRNMTLPTPTTRTMAARATTVNDNLAATMCLAMTSTGSKRWKTWLRTYSIAIQAAHSDNDIMAAYFPVMMGPQALN